MSEKSQLRRFGLTFSLALALWGSLFIWRKKDCYFYLFVLSTIFFFFAIFMPLILRPIQKILIVLSMLLSRFIKIIIASFLFFLVFTPIGLLARCFGKRFLDLKFPDNKGSYWIARKTDKVEKKDYLKQY